VYQDPELLNTGENYTPGKRATSSYDNNLASWTMSGEYSLKKDRDRKFFQGQFLWSGQDYIGEPTPYNVFPVKASFFGAVDTAGFPKDAYHLFKSQWSSEPMVHIVPMNWTDHSAGENVAVCEDLLAGEHLRAWRAAAEPLARSFVASQVAGAAKLSDQRRERAERAAAVAYRVLFCRCHLRHGPPLGRGHEDRVVAEAVRTTRLYGEPAQDLAFHHTLDGGTLRSRRARHHKGGGTGELGAPPSGRHVLKLCEDELQVGHIVAVSPGPAGGQYPWHAVQRIDVETRIVGDRGQPREIRHRACLDQRVLGERGAGLCGFRRAGEVGQAGQVDRSSTDGTCGQDPGQLGDLVRVPRGEHHAQCW